MRQMAFTISSFRKRQDIIGIQKCRKQLFSYLFEHCTTHLADVPVALIPYFSEDVYKRQPMQTADFLSEVVQPVLARYEELPEEKPEINV